MGNKLFSERYGYKKPGEVFQINELSERTRNILFDIFNGVINKHYTPLQGFDGGEYEIFKDLENVYIEIMHKIFGDSITKEPPTLVNIGMKVEQIFLHGPFEDLMDTIEIFIANDVPEETKRFEEILNHIFKEEMVQYRIVNGLITQITDEIEIKEIEEAM